MKRTIPERIAQPAPADYLAVMSRAVFQAGLSWKLIDAKWAAYRRLFKEFEPAAVAAFDDDDIARIAADPGIVRTRKKVEATVGNARALLEVERQHGRVADYLRSFDGYDALVRDIRARFRFVGALSAYYFLFRVGEPVPKFEEWERSVPGDHPRMREMIAQARARGWNG